MIVDSVFFLLQLLYLNASDSACRVVAYSPSGKTFTRANQPKTVMLCQSKFLRPCGGILFFIDFLKSMFSFNGKSSYICLYFCNCKQTFADMPVCKHCFTVIWEVNWRTGNAGWYSFVSRIEGKLL